MILIFGGTTEGRIAAETADEAGQPFFYSTRGERQEVACRHLVRITGSMESAEMVTFCREHHIRLIIDAAHPFAEQLHTNIARAAAETGLPVVRLERTFPSLPSQVIRCRDFHEAVARLRADGIERLLALTGTQTIPKLKAFWEGRDCIFRILEREESVEIARRAGFPPERLVYYRPEEESEADLLRRIAPQAIITKESGTSGGFAEKMEAALAQGVRIYVVCRPPLPESFITVTGRHGLRRAIEQHVPGFYALRSGFTTGSCATAAAKAALLALVEEQVVDEVDICLPDEEIICLPIAAVERIDEQTARATVVKDAGDDPDVTHGHRIVATVSFTTTPGIRFLQGEGVGTVTLPGLGLPVGGPAINNTPRQMMTRELSTLYRGGLDVTISVPGGAELAQKTFNPKLGIVGGISIIGTSGIVRPFSSEAFVDAIRKEVEVAHAVGAERLVINSGAKSERYVKALYPTLPSQAFVHYGNFIGETLQIASEVGFAHVSMGIMIGKAVKLAEGHLDTHSKKVVMNKTFLRTLAAQTGCSAQADRLIAEMTLARELWGLPQPEDRRRLFPALARLCLETCHPLLPNGTLTLLLIDEAGEIACHISSAD